MAEPGDKEYHRRNVIVDRDLVLRAMDWHGGQGSMVYSFASTGLEDYVSPSMIDAAVSELEFDYAQNAKLPKDRRSTKKEMAELKDLIGELDEVARFSSEHTIKEATGEDEDSGYATWLMEEENPRGKKKAVAKRKGKKVAKRPPARRSVPRKKKDETWVAYHTRLSDLIFKANKAGEYAYSAQLQARSGELAKKYKSIRSPRRGKPKRGPRGGIVKAKGPGSYPWETCIAQQTARGVDSPAAVCGSIRARSRKKYPVYWEARGNPGSKGNPELSKKQQKILRNWMMKDYDGDRLFTFDDLPDNVQSALGGRGREFGRLQLWHEAVQDFVLAGGQSVQVDPHGLTGWVSEVEKKAARKRMDAMRKTVFSQADFDKASGGNPLVRAWLEAEYIGFVPHTGNPKQNPFMVPQYVKADVWLVETSHGTEPVFADLVGKKPDLEDFADYVEGDDISEVELLKGKYWAQLSAPGYMDQTSWGGPFDSLKEAKKYIEDTYDVDPETGAHLEENPGRRRTIKFTPTADQAEALRSYKVWAGKKWQSQLQSDFMRAGSLWPGEWALLQQVRNAPGGIQWAIGGNGNGKKKAKKSKKTKTKKVVKGVRGLVSRALK